MSTIIRDRKIRSDLKMASRILGVKENDLSKRAMTFYLHTIRDQISLKREFDALDKFSDEAFIGMNL
jgi:hypothetical protein